MSSTYEGTEIVSAPGPLISPTESFLYNLLISFNSFPTTIPSYTKNTNSLQSRDLPPLVGGLQVVLIEIPLKRNSSLGILLVVASEAALK
jgi:hypothetical protein